MLLSAKNIKKSYGSLTVLKGINLEIKAKEVISIVGPSGAGKSTLLHILGTLDKADSGDLFFENTNITNYKPKQLASFRNEKIGFVFQFHHLLPEFTAQENVFIPAMIARKKPQEYKQKALYFLETMGLKDRAGHKPSELSGGEKQRVAVARALMNDPAIIFADEPSGNLDSKNAIELHQLFFNLRDEFGQSFVIVTHNEQLAKETDRTIHLKDGLVNLES